MKITEIEIKNFGSLKNVKLNELGNLIVIVGENGSGKTFLFDALQLFFQEFRITGGDSTVKVNENFWYLRSTRRSIMISLSFKLSGSEAISYFSDWWKLSGKPIKALKGKSHLLEISRRLIYKKGWYTSKIRLNNETFVTGDKIVMPGKKQKKKKLPDLTSWRLYLFNEEFSAEKIGGERLLVNESINKAYFSDENSDKLASRGLVNVSVEHLGTDFREWVQSKGFELLERVPNQEEAPEIIESIEIIASQEKALQYNDKLERCIRRYFSLLPAVRESRSKSIIRFSIIDNKNLRKMGELPAPGSRRAETQWHKLRTTMEQFLHEKQLEPISNQILIRDQDFRMQFPYLGGGEQSAANFAWEFLHPSRLIGVEEPENHLHPGLAKKVFNFLRKASLSSQIILSTHSPMFVDKDEVDNNFLFRIENRETAVKHAVKTEDLKLILAELGVVPSDIYLKALIVFVEGGTEKCAVLPIWAEKLGIDLGEDSPKIGLINIGGETRLKDNLRIWLEVMKYAPADYLIILDSHSKKLAEEVRKEMKIPKDKFRIWRESCIEDYYPVKYVKNGLNNLFEIAIDEEKLKKKDRAKIIKEELEKEGKIQKGWKLSLGDYVARRMKLAEIPHEIKKVLKNINERVSP